ncbi:MAG: helix-turn-helix domain-containing protein [Alphaproteobacteria bacterium]|jgi:transcriptional regulator with XRE-family HTH domain|nr:helix-turn-helix domain-containing protein [Alphaproteobacteria bacterium]
MAKTTEAIERGNRLRTLREQTGLSRAQFAHEVNINEHTLKSFELGARELPLQKAREYSRIFLFAGIDVSFEYLYYGKEAEASNQGDALINDDLNIQNEVIYFKKINPLSIIFTIPDSLMSPIYNKGDIVGGQKITNENQFSLLNGHICIIEGSRGQQALRRIIKTDGRNIVACTLRADDGMPPLVEEIEAFSLAQVSRHWHVYESIGNIYTQPTISSNHSSLHDPDLHPIRSRN